MNRIKEIYCKTCGALHLAKRTDANCPACRLAYKRNWIRNNSQYYRDRYHANRENELERSKKYHASHKLHEKKYRRGYLLSHRSEANARDAKRRAQEKRALAPWANEFFIREIYALAALRTKMFGFAWHVDHIVPLQNKMVCGLHVEDNLQVIPATENLRKSNSFWTDMP